MIVPTMLVSSAIVTVPSRRAQDNVRQRQGVSVNVTVSDPSSRPSPTGAIVIVVDDDSPSGIVTGHEKRR